MSNQESNLKVGREIIHFLSTFATFIIPLVGLGASVSKAIEQGSEIAKGANYHFMSPDGVMPYVILTCLSTGLSYLISQATRDPNGPPDIDE